MDQPAFAEAWNYCSVIGKLQFLAQNTCPDILTQSTNVHDSAQIRD
jgi:hypothetical protein